MENSNLPNNSNPKNEKSGRQAVILLVLVIIILLIAGVIGEELKEFDKIKKPKLIVPKTSTSILNSRWKRYFVGSSLSLLSPGPLKLERFDAPENIRSNFQDMQYYIYKTDTFVLSAAFEEYKNGININLQEAYNLAMKILAQMKGVTEFHHSQQSMIISEREALSISARYNSGGMRFVVREYLIVDGSKLWQVSLVYSETDTIAAKVASKVLDSMEIQ